MPALASLNRDYSFEASTFWALLSVVAPVCMSAVGVGAGVIAGGTAFLGALLFALWPIGSFLGVVLGVRRIRRDWSLQSWIETAIAAASAGIFVYTVSGIEFP